MKIRSGKKTAADESKLTNSMVTGYGRVVSEQDISPMAVVKALTGKRWVELWCAVYNVVGIVKSGVSAPV